MRASKFKRIPIQDGKTTCPICGTVNNHTTGNHCGHVHKITANRIAFYWWGYRPEGFNANMQGKEMTA